MSALAFLLKLRLKNSIREFFKSPSKVILLVFVLLMMGVSFMSGNFGSAANEGNYRDIRELYALMFALFLLIFISVAASGLKNGASFFTMADVNILFNAPISTKRILIYGLIRQLGMSAMLALFLLYQYSWLSSSYGVGFTDLLAIIAGYVLTIFCAQMCSMCIYTFTSHSDRRRSVVRAVIYVLVGVIAAYVLYPLLTATDKLAAVVERVSSPALYFVPVAGWMKAFSEGLIGSQWLFAALGGGAGLAFILLFVLIITKIDADYYEDVLVATEVTYSAITAKKEGRVAETTPQSIKKGKTGLGRGRGAFTFFYKHLLEDRRASVFIFDTFTLIVIAASALFSFFMRSLGMIGPFCFSIYLMIFSSMASRWSREFTQPYIYMVPADPFAKLIAVSLQQIIRSVVESVVTVTLIGLICGGSPAQIAGYSAVRIGFGMLFIACNVLIMRLFGGKLGRALQMTFFFIALLILSAPGIIGGIIAGAILGELAGLLIIFGWLVVVSAVICFLCRDILVTAELNNK